MSEEQSAELYKIIKTLKKSEREEVQLVLNQETRSLLIRKIIQDQGTSYLKMKQLSHRFLPKIIDAWEQGNETIVLEEFIKGSSLGQILHDEGALKSKEVLRIGLQLCDVLAYLHKEKLIHRDIKPDNILLTEKGIIKLVDFDAARKVKEEENNDTQYLGTRGYAPPEQYGFAQTDQRADIYALGVTLKELLGPHYRGGMLRATAKCMEIDPKNRYQTMRKVKSGLKKSIHPIIYGISKILYLIGCITVAIFVISLLFGLLWSGDVPPQPKASDAMPQIMAAETQPTPAPLLDPRDLIPERALLSNVIEVSDYFGGSAKDFSDATGVALKFSGTQGNIKSYSCQDFTIYEIDNKIYALVTRELSGKFSYYGLEKGFSKYFTDYQGESTMRSLTSVLSEQFDFYDEQHLIQTYLQKGTRYMLTCTFGKDGDSTGIAIILDDQLPFRNHRKKLNESALISEDFAPFDQAYHAMTTAQQDDFIKQNTGKRVIWTGVVDTVSSKQITLASGDTMCDVTFDLVYRDVVQQLHKGDKIKVEGLLSGKPGMLMGYWFIRSAIIETF